MAAWEKQCSETGAWFMEGEVFLKWKQSTTFLWMHGNSMSQVCNLFHVVMQNAAGSGKTIPW